MKHSPSKIRFVGCVASLLIGLLDIRAESTLGDLIATGDRFDVTFQTTEALANYLQAEKLDPNNVGLMVSIARQYRHLMVDAISDEESRRLGGIALSYGKKAATLGLSDSEAQLSQAITYGKLLPFEGKKEQVASVRLIKLAVDKALIINPQSDTAWHVLGRWHQSLANVSAIQQTLGGLIYGPLPKSTNEEAVACFEKAIAINPNRLRHYVELGRTYSFMHQMPDARRYIEKGLAMPNTEKDDPEIKVRGLATLATLP